MGNSCVQNTIIEKNNINDRYVVNKKNIHIWPELQNQNIQLVLPILFRKGYDVYITEHSDFNCKQIRYNRIVLYIENGLVKNIPRNG
jgi:hypothetical protein